MSIDTTVIDNIITGYLPHSIYAFETNTHPNYLKVGDTNRKVSARLAEWKKVYKDLEQKFEAEAMLEDEQGEKTIFFRDYAVHDFLIEDKHRKRLSTQQFEREFFQNATVSDVEAGIIDIQTEYKKNGVSRYNYYRVGEENSTIEQHWSRTATYSPRPNQAQVIENIVKAVQEKHRKNLLLYAVMRFGKSNVAIWSAKRLNSKLTVIVTGKADVKDEWKRTVESHVDFEDFVFIGASDFDQEFTEANPDKKFVVFTTLQDLAGSRENVKEKHQFLFENTVDFLVIDESHFGARARIYSQAIENQEDNVDELDMTDEAFDEALETINSLNSQVKLHLSGTPYRILLSNEFQTDDIVGKIQFSDILTEKKKWIEEHTSNTDVLDADDKPWENPYFGFPEMVRFAFTPNKSSVKMLDELKELGQTAELNELFAPDSTAKSKKNTAVFKHESDVLNLLKAIDGSSEDENIFPFLNYDKIQSGKLAQHMVFVLPFKNSCDTMERLLNKNREKFYHLGEYQILNVAGNTSTLGKPSAIQEQIKKYATDGQKTITLTVNKMLTGSTVPEWDTMVFLKDTKSPQDYDQAIFRLQSPWTKEIRDIKTDKVIGKEDMKPQTLLIDFSPNRMFKIESDRAIVVNAADGRSGNDQQEIELRKNILVSPIIYLNRDKLKEATPSDIIAAIRKYSENASIMDEVMEIPVDDKLYDYPEFKAEIARQAELGSKAGLETKGYEGEGDDLTSPNSPDNDSNPNSRDKSENSDGNNSTPESDLPTPKQMQTYYSRILFYAFLSKDDEKNLSNIIDNIESTDDNRRLARHLGLKKSILEIIKRHLNFGILSTLDNKIENIGDLRSDSGQQNILKGIKKFGRISPSEVFTPEWVAEMMVNSLVTQKFIDDYKESPVNIIDFTSKSGVYLIKIYQKLISAGINHEVLRDHLFAVSTSDTGFEFTRAVYEDFGWNLGNLVDSDMLNSYQLIKEQSNIDKFKKTIGGNDLKFDVVLGNPPYQEKDGGAGASSTPIYPNFVNAAKELGAKKVAFITPSRWFVGGKGLNSFRDTMLNDPHLRELHDWLKPELVFPNTNIRGGVNYFVLDDDWNNTISKTIVTTYTDKTHGIKIKRPMKTGNLEIFIREQKSVEILEKINYYYENSKLDFKSMSEYVSSRKPFGFSTTFVKDPKFHAEKNTLSDPVVCYGNNKIGYVERQDIQTNANWINSWKVFTTRANNIGTELNDDNFNTIIGKPNTSCTETYILIGAELNLDENATKNLSKYLKTKFVRFLHGLAKASFDATKSTYRFIPIQNFSKDSEIDWTLSSEEIDKKLYEMYQFNESEIIFIENKIKPMN